MYTVVYPSLWGKHALLLSRILETRDGFIDNEVDCFDAPSTIYVGYEKEAYGAFGSCRLNSLDVSPVATFYNEIGLKDYLEVSLVSLQVDENHWLTKSEAAVYRFKVSFFQGLYRVLADVARGMGCKGLVAVNFNGEIASYLRKWPFTESYSFNSQKYGRNFCISKLPLCEEKNCCPLRIRAV